MLSLRSDLLMSPSLLIKNATIVTLDPANRIFQGHVFIPDRRIAGVEPAGSSSRFPSVDQTIDASGCVLLPGFVQAHLHLCQTLFRGSADDLPLIDWLSKRIWPMEAAHTADSVYASARLAIAELIRGGTTCALTMETVHHTEAALRAVHETGFRAIVGKCLMDTGAGVPAGLLQSETEAMRETLDLFRLWHGRDEGRVRCCFAPRFALSCSRELLEKTARLAADMGAIIHTHAA
ncbi:MAG: amidohydrolase family protein, partial [Blastocatellia bacterium]